MHACLCVTFINVHLEKLYRHYITDLTDLHYSYQWAHSLLLGGPVSTSGVINLGPLSLGLDTLSVWPAHQKVKENALTNNIMLFNNSHTTTTQNEHSDNTSCKQITCSCLDKTHNKTFHIKHLKHCTITVCNADMLVCGR